MSAEKTLLRYAEEVRSFTTSMAARAVGLCKLTILSVVRMWRARGLVIEPVPCIYVLVTRLQCEDRGACTMFYNAFKSALEEALSESGPTIRIYLRSIAAKVRTLFSQNSKTHRETVPPVVYHIVREFVRRTIREAGLDEACTLRKSSSQGYYIVFRKGDDSAERLLAGARRALLLDLA